MTELKIDPIEINWELPAGVIKTKSNIRLILYKIGDIIVECLFFLFLIFFSIAKNASKYTKKKEVDK